MNLNDFAKEVHENAVAHGWWDEPRSDGTLRSLMHAELSEALEEYRANRPMVWHLCKHGGMCEHQEVHCGQVGCETCTPEQRKPEGVAVELIDFVIRALDTMAAKNVFASIPDTENLMIEYELLVREEGNFTKTLDLPDMVDALHFYLAADCRYSWQDLPGVIGVALAWVKEHGIDPVALMIEKHEYNKHRPYKHGGKVC